MNIRRFNIKTLGYALDLIIADLIVFILLISIIFEINVLRVITGIVSVIFIPGYTFVSALFPDKKEIDGIERIALSFGTSIAITPLLGLSLNYTPFGIKLVPVLITVSGFTFIMSIIAYIRRGKLPEERRFSVEFYKIKLLLDSFNQQKGLDKMLSVLLLISIISALGMLIYVISTPKVGERFTEFYILGRHGKASDYPEKLKPGEEAYVIVGIRNNEYRAMKYFFEVRLENETVEEREIELMHNQSIEFPFRFRVYKKGENMKLEFLLYKKGSSIPYRELHLWIDVE